MTVVKVIMLIWIASINGAPAEITFPTMEGCEAARAAVLGQQQKFTVPIIRCVPVYE